MVVGDHANSYKPFVNDDWMWDYGAEVWCNLPGRYVTVHADLSHLNGSYEMSICNIGLFGTKYARASTVSEYVYLKPYDVYIKIKIDHVASTYYIGNTLDIKLRVKNHAQFGWVAIECNASFCEVTFARIDLEGV